MNSRDTRAAVRAARAAAAGLAATAVLAACAESSVTGRRPTSDAATVPLIPLATEGVRASLALVDSAAGSATVVVAIDARGLDVGAYQGEVGYDRDALELVSAEAVRPATGGGNRYVNAGAGGGDGAGAVRFAGFRADGPVAARGGDQVARLVFRVRDWSAVGALRVTLEAAGGADGRAVSGTRLMTGARVVSALGAGGAR